MQDAFLPPGKINSWGGSLSLLAAPVALGRQWKPCKAAVLVLLGHGSFLQGFEAVGSAMGLLEVDLIQVGGFAGGFLQTAAAHEVVLWDRGHRHRDTTTGPLLLLRGSG